MVGINGGRGRAVPAARRRAVQVDPIKPTLKPPGYMLLKLRYDGPISNFAFNFNWRRYTEADPTQALDAAAVWPLDPAAWGGAPRPTASPVTVTVRYGQTVGAGGPGGGVRDGVSVGGGSEATVGPALAKVGRCRLTQSNLELKAPGTNLLTLRV